MASRLVPPSEQEGFTHVQIVKPQMNADEHR
jgi:hypothetical protein